jgi:hypothetical protein
VIEQSQASHSLYRLLEPWQPLEEHQLLGLHGQAPASALGATATSSRSASFPIFVIM